MGFAIPKLQYNNLSLVGDIMNGSGVITGIADTSEILVGMFVRGTGIPAGAIVLSTTASTITLANSVLSTATTTDIDIELGFEVVFQYPPKEVTGESIEASQNSSDSLSGIRQTSINYLEGLRKPVFSFLSPTIYAQLDTFLRTWGAYGKTFRYFEDQTLTQYTEFELDSLKFTPKKLAPKGLDIYVWEVPLAFRRVL